MNFNCIACQNPISSRNEYSEDGAHSFNCTQCSMGYLVEYQVIKYVYFRGIKYNTISVNIKEGFTLLVTPSSMTHVPSIFWIFMDNISQFEEKVEKLIPLL